MNSSSHSWMPIIYWCCSRGKVYLQVQRLLPHPHVWLLSESDRATVQWYIMCQVSDVFRQLKFAFVSHVHIPSCHTGASCFLAPELILWALGHIYHMALCSNISLHCSAQPPAAAHCKSDSKWLSWFPWKPGAQRSGKIHFTLQQRDKELVRQRESGRDWGLKRESGGVVGSLTLKDASFVQPLCLRIELK